MDGPVTFPADAVRAVVRLCRSVEKVVSENGLTLAQFRILDRLADGSAPGANLADWLAVKPPSVTTVVDGLVKRRLVERTVDAADRRQVTHALTPDGRTLHATVSDSVAHRLGEVLAALPEDGRPATQYRTMIDALAAWNQAFDEALAARRAASGALAVIPTSTAPHRGVGWRPPRRGMDPRPRTDPRALPRAMPAAIALAVVSQVFLALVPLVQKVILDDAVVTAGALALPVDRGPAVGVGVVSFVTNYLPPTARRGGRGHVQRDLQVAMHRHMQHLDASRHDHLRPAT